MQFLREFVCIYDDDFPPFYLCTQHQKLAPELVLLRNHKENNNKTPSFPVHTAKTII